jgi:hypothetical protein
MSKSPVTLTVTGPPAAPSNYSKDLPETSKERDRAVPEFAESVPAEQQAPDPRSPTTPYGGGTVNGSNDSSRFSTPPAKKSSPCALAERRVDDSAASALLKVPVPEPRADP